MSATDEMELTDQDGPTPSDLENAIDDALHGIAWKEI